MRVTGGEKEDFLSVLPAGDASFRRRGESGWKPVNFQTAGGNLILRALATWRSSPLTLIQELERSLWLRKT